MSQSAVAHIETFPPEPVTLFKQLIDAFSKQSIDGLTLMNLATVDEEFGVLNRNVLYRGLSDDDCIIYVTQRFTRNFKNLHANTKCSIAFFMPQVVLPSQGPNPALWQVRLIGATAEELPDSQLDAWWEKELLSSQIRDYVFPCGQPVEYRELVAKHDQFLADHLASGQPLKRPATYTAFKFRAQRWDFLKAGSGQIPDRVQYRRQPNGEWLATHVST
ncbi:pyridoxine/pyridoxamine 5'-phosphate oxidase [Drosophila sulfurigaster albostrigata]|uniref:pyridoxine/pyridoxamine 5'-phosphate oxidase n=1 Tax=Drosophila sulfurigaster albostrigata TaxID=89887 RepID=UPI002D21963A|nr:pyridoxine/pyridoxamine 5'-phosphate oxidase [Drosophila sulfurigaster albostrigata]